jgi:hypothetical protein
MTRQELTSEPTTKNIRLYGNRSNYKMGINKSFLMVVALMSPYHTYPHLLSLNSIPRIEIHSDHKVSRTISIGNNK